jgi:predicted ATPase/DNA-binding winged helix-turn-helix (wHTH) protein
MLTTGFDYLFGPFRLVPAQQLLLEADKAVQIGSRALQILVFLVERAGGLVSRDELVGGVWPDTVVGEGSLRVHIAALRKALRDGQNGNRYIVNETGRGYRFVTPVSRAQARAEPPSDHIRGEPTHNLPIQLGNAIGRADIVAAICGKLPRSHFVTIVGPGGVGKTTVALAVAGQLSASYADGVRFVDLGSLADPHLVPSALASVLGLEVRSENPIPSLVAALRDKRMLLVLDSCDHVIDAVSTAAVQILGGASSVDILATSREAFRAEGEHVYRLTPLKFPATSERMTAAHALTFPAVQLFVDRATACLDSFEFTDATAPAVADICRRLDGIPLAIELAAARIDTFGVQGLAGLIDRRFQLLRSGRRTALPRHQTLMATLDWSHESLSPSERTVLRRLGVFPGTFTLEAAAAIAGDTELTADHVVESTADLIGKSLVVADITGKIGRYRLLESTRAYALEKLADSADATWLARRHAEYFQSVAEQAEAELDTLPLAEWLATYSAQLHNIRAALDWAFSPAGDATVGVALTVAAVPLWMHLSLMEECRGRVAQAIGSDAAHASPEPRRDMRLFAAMGAALLYTRGPGPEIEAAWTRTLGIAESLGDTDHQLRALWGLLTNRLNNFEIRAGLTLAERFIDTASASHDPNDLLIGHRLLGGTLFFLGDQTGARRNIEHMLDGYVSTPHRSDAIRFQFDQTVRARSTLAEILWLQGFPDRANDMAKRNVAAAQSTRHVHTLCNALAQGACPIALACGDLGAAEQFIESLLDHAMRHGLARWQAWSRCFFGILGIRQGDTVRGLRMLQSALEEFPSTVFAVRYISFRGEQACAHGAVGEIAPAMEVIDDALARAEKTEERWCLAELLRIKGELMLRQGAPDAAESAARYFEQSLAWSRRQGVRAFELRAATSFARACREQGRGADAYSLLAPVYRAFDEGFETVDLGAARALLGDLASPHENG